MGVSNIKYRPEIDGLRAVAVFAVIFYHAELYFFDYNFFKGGFIGVDIFFVISGYLITSIILTELIKTGRFSFKYFYQRRIRRILPVLLFIMLVSIPFASAYLMPISSSDFYKSILYSLGFSSNFYFHYSGLQYGADDGLLIPLLHTWSLSVEEQYYIIFPVILILVFKYFKEYLIHFLVIGFVISLSLAEWGSRNHPSINFYILPTRGWELIAGSILAYFEIIKGYRSKNKILNLSMPTIGLFFILVSIIFFNDEMFHPSYYTLIPIIGICLIIWFSNKDEIVTKIFSSRLFVSIGLISYSLYLWHFPIFAFARITDFIGDNSNLFKIYLIIVTIILSILSFFFVERPFRNKQNKRSLSYIFVGIILVTLISSYQIISVSAKLSKIKQLEESHKNLINKNWRPDGAPFSHNGEKCHNNILGCHVNHGKKKNVVIIGDSHASWILNDLNEKIKDKYNFITFTANSCFPFLGFKRIETKTKKELPNCKTKYIETVYEFLKNEKNSIIILHSFWKDIFDDESRIRFVSDDQKKITTFFKEIIDEIKINNEIILVYPTPHFKRRVPDLILAKKKNYDLLNFKKDLETKANFNFNVTTDFNKFKNDNQITLDLFDSIKDEKVKKVYSYNLFCKTNENKCYGNNKEDIFFRDKDHLSSRGSLMIVTEILSKFE